MTTSSHLMGSASDSLLKATGIEWPSDYTGRELRREAERIQRRAAKPANTAPKKGFGQ